MKSRVVMVVLLFLVCDHSYSLRVAHIPSSDIFFNIGEYQYILHVEIISATTNRYRNGSWPTRFNCGIRYGARILEKVKGGNLPEYIYFSSNGVYGGNRFDGGHIFSTGSEYLIFLYNTRISSSYMKDKDCSRKPKDLHTGANARTLKFTRLITEGDVVDWLIYDDPYTMDLTHNLLKEMGMETRKTSLCYVRHDSDACTTREYNIKEYKVIRWSKFRSMLYRKLENGGASISQDMRPSIKRIREQ